jgi:hypothetical protein
MISGASPIVDRNLVKIDLQAVALLVAVREEMDLKHFNRRKINPRHDIGRVESRLFRIRDKLKKLYPSREAA